jgi:TRAP-type C4-dicarboxylate transport system permease small subunit
MKPEKTPGYWRTRILLVFTVAYTAIVLAWAFWSATLTTFDERVGVLGLSATVVVSGLAAGLALFGLAWAIRIFRGSRDEPPPWRYRDR